MNSSSSEIKVNKNKIKNYGKNLNRKKPLTISLFILILIVLLISTPIKLFSATASVYEPSLNSILSDLGFTNIALTGVQTFLPGTYNITLMAEFASYNAQNELSYYGIGTSDFRTIFTGPEGAFGPLGGFIVPHTFKYFVSDSQFGLSMLAPDYRYYTEHYLNPDYPEIHAKVYENLDTPGMYLIGFENRFGGYDRDYNDIVFSLVQISPPEIVSLTISPEDPSYDQSVIVAAQVSKGNFDIESVIMSYQRESDNWINVTTNFYAGLYFADIPAQPFKTKVNYKVSVIDQIGYSDVSTAHSYIVGDKVPPVIYSVHTPKYPRPNQSVKVLATITEPPEASGVNNGTLWYTAGIAWFSLEMTLQNGKWTANIPGQAVGTTVKYYIEAFDNAENSVETSIATYTHVPNGAPIADYTASPSIVFTSEGIDFDGSSSYDLDGHLVGYAWDFGDGTSGSGVTANHSYVDNGEYLVTLTVVDEEGAIGSKTASVIVKNRSPEADFFVSSTILDKQETATFDAGESYDPDGIIVNYLWDFGDGSTANGVQVSHLYYNVGAYTTILTVTDDDEATDTAAATQTVGNHPPIALIGDTATAIHVGEMITFTAAESYDRDGFIVSYEWDFGDGTTGNGITVTNTYEDKDTYTVKLTIIDNDGATDSTAVIKNVINRKPVALFTKTMGTVKIGETITFDASGSYDPDGIIVTYVWDFGDGNRGTGITTNHAYIENGTYTITLIVTDNDGEKDTISTTVTVLVANRAPIASFTESAETVSTGERIHFDASASYDPDGIIIAFAWNFGDGVTAVGIATDHTYQDNGVYTVTLTVTDNDNAINSFKVTKTVLNRAPVASFAESAKIVVENEIIHFNASGSYDPDGIIVTYVWDFGDGNRGTGITTNHAYIENGTYTITLIVTDNDGDSTSFAAEITVEILEAVNLAVLSVIGLGVAALTATFFYGFSVRRKKKKEKENVLA